MNIHSNINTYHSPSAAKSSSLTQPRSGSKRSPDEISNSAKKARSQLIDTPGTAASQVLSNLKLSSPVRLISIETEGSSSKALPARSTLFHLKQQNVLDLLKNPELLAKEESFNLINNLDTLIFGCRKENTEERPLELYEPHTLLKTCHLSSQTLETSNEREARLLYKTLNSLLNTALAFMTIKQKESLFHLLTQSDVASNPSYKILSTICFKKYFLEVDPKKGSEMDSLPPYDTILKHVIQRAKEENSKSVEDLASRLLELFLEEGFPANYFFHYTQEIENIPPLLENGVLVTHNKAKKGAFVSSHPEPSFGKYGVAVSVHSLAARHLHLSHLERRHIEDSGHVWIGASAPLPTLPICLYPENISAIEKHDLKNSMPENFLLIPTSVQETFLIYARELGWTVPVPQNSTQKDLKISARGPEN